MLCIMMLFSLCACSDTEERRTVYAMDTVMTLVAYGSNASEGLDAAAGVISAMDSTLDPESEDSDTSIINTADGNPVTVSSWVAEMLNTALNVYSKSGGALDLSVYPLYLAWGCFDPETGRIPSDDEIARLRKTMDFSGISVASFSGESEATVQAPKGIQISFGATAKGCASKHAINAMRKAGVESAIISLGGNVQTLGKKPDGSNWTVAVQDPNDPASYLGTLSVGETAVVTSGNYQRYFIGDDGEKYHHIIDPDTGKPVDNDLLSVTIICEDGTLADCLSTAMYVLGENSALRYWRTNGGFEMIMVKSNGSVLCTTGLVEMFTLTNTSGYTVSFVE